MNLWVDLRGRTLPLSSTRTPPECDLRRPYRCYSICASRMECHISLVIVSDISQMGSAGRHRSAPLLNCGLSRRASEGTCRREGCWKLSGRALRRDEVTGSGGEVNRLRARFLTKPLPAINPRLRGGRLLRMVICPQASSAQNSMAALLAEGRTVCVLIRRLNSS